jgi:Domain of unknown function (DUF4402)
VKKPLFLALCSLLAIVPMPLAAQESCRLCYSSGGAQPGDHPLTIEIFADLSFSRLAMTGSGAGSAEIDAQTGAKRTAGSVIDLGGMAVQGRGRITGEPGRTVRVDLPGQVTMASPDGDAAELVDFRTDLPDFPKLDGAGALEFSFGARLVVRGRQGGNYRGRIPITVDYN